MGAKAIGETEDGGEKNEFPRERAPGFVAGRNGVFVSRFDAVPGICEREDGGCGKQEEGEEEARLIEPLAEIDKNNGEDLRECGEEGDFREAHMTERFSPQEQKKAESCASEHRPEEKRQGRKHRSVETLKETRQKRLPSFVFKDRRNAAKERRRKHENRKRRRGPFCIPER